MRTVTIVASDLDSNSVQRACTFVQLLQSDFKVHVIGHTSSGQIWEPMRAFHDVDFRPLTFRHALAPHLWGRRELKVIDGDVIIAHKAVNTSFGFALHARRVLGVPVLVDVEEWELGLIGHSVYWEFRLAPRRWLFEANSPLYTRLLDRKVTSADAVTVTNSFLQRRYGGTLIPHARDESRFRPAPVHRPGEQIVMFLGSIRPHKGLNTLLDAWARLGLTDASLHIVGTPLDHPEVIKLKALGGDRVKFHGYVSHQDVPDILRTASAFVIPQLAGNAALGQLPTKLIEAMATGLPVISSEVGDIPSWLADDAGIVVPPGDSEALAAALHRVLREPGVSRMLGEKARQRFLERASFAAVRPSLVGVVDRLMQKGPRRGTH
jgi:glycosyltransferase involved in cell wall biosynthesis